MIKKVDQFIKVRRDWLGEGGEPVPLEQAQARADVCTGRLTGNPCKFNYQGSWLWSMITSMAIRSQMTLRHIMNLKLEGEDTLRTCEVCGCPLKLKVHVPFKHIYRHTTPDHFSKFPDFCWKRIELKQFKNNT